MKLESPSLKFVIVKETPAPPTNKIYAPENSHQEVKDPVKGSVDHRAIEMPTIAGHSTIAVLKPSDSRSLRTAALKGNLGVPEPDPELVVVGVGVGVGDPTSPLPRGGAMIVDTAGDGPLGLGLELVSLEFGWALGSL